MPPKPLSAEYFDGWYADQAATPAVAAIMNRHAGFPPGTRAGVVPAEAIPELAEELRPCWEPFDRADERLSPRLRRANLAAPAPERPAPPRTGRRNQPPVRPVRTERSVAHSAGGEPGSR